MALYCSRKYMHVLPTEGIGISLGWGWWCSFVRPKYLKKCIKSLIWISRGVGGGALDIFWSYSDQVHIQYNLARGCGLTVQISSKDKFSSMTIPSSFTVMVKFREFGNPSRQYPIVENFLNTCHLFAWQSVNNARRKNMLITPGKSKVYENEDCGNTELLLTTTGNSKHKQWWMEEIFNFEIIVAITLRNTIYIIFIPQRNHTRVKSASLFPRNSHNDWIYIL